MEFDFMYCDNTNCSLQFEGQCTALKENDICLEQFADDEDGEEE